MDRRFKEFRWQDQCKDQSESKKTIRGIPMLPIETSLIVRGGVNDIFTLRVIKPCFGKRKLTEDAQEWEEPSFSHSTHEANLH